MRPRKINACAAIPVRTRKQSHVFIKDFFCFFWEVSPHALDHRLRARASENATYRLSQLKGRTGLTPNILCRIAFCLSLKERGIPTEKHDSQGMEFNRYTLTGEWDTFYMALLKTRLINDGLDPNEDLLINFKEHIERGVILFYNRVKRFSDLATIAD